jgi:hypothetical protein
LRRRFGRFPEEADPMLGPKCGGRMKIMAFLADFSVVDRIIKYFS